VKKFIFIIIISFVLFTSFPTSAAVHGPQVHVNLDQITLKGGIEKLGQIFDTKIVIVCDNSQIPQDRFSLILEQATLEQSIKEIMRRAKVKNHALFLNQDNKTALVWILSAEKKDIIDSKVANNILLEKDSEPMTPGQMFLLVQNSQEQAEMDYKPLTAEQTEQLQEQGGEMEAEEAEIEKSIQSLTQDQIDQLKDQSFWIEGEMEEVPSPLPVEQLEKLEKHHVEIESENEGSLQPLRKEQLFLLKEQEPDY
jgi:hypothetical protein